jgi:hypothetical protein
MGRRPPSYRRFPPPIDPLWLFVAVLVIFLLVVRVFF